VINPDDPDDIETKRAEADEHIVPNLDETDEVTYLKKLHHNLHKQEVLIAIMLDTQHSVNLCRIKFSEIEKDKDGKELPKVEVFFTQHQIVQEKKERKLNSGVDERIEVQANRNDNGTDLMFHFQEEFDKFTKRKAYKKKQHYLV
jgi:hypothetical protein